MTAKAKTEAVKYLTRDEILNCQDIQEELVDVPEWGGSVLVRGMTGSERDIYEASLLDMNEKTGNAKFKADNVRAKLLQKTIVDHDTKQPIFSVADIAALGAKSVAALDRVFKVAQKLSKITEEDIDELTKNL